MGISLWINLAGRPEGLLSDSEKMESRARRRWGVHDGPCFQGSMD